MSAVPRVLAIGGSDSGGGAGIQQDLKTLAALGCWGYSAITSVTAQSSIEVRSRFDLPAETVEAQIRVVLDDAEIDAAKTGMLATAEIVHAIARVAPELPNLVVDPVIVSTSGSRLLDEDAVAALVELLLPHATVITPNAAEATALTGIDVTDLASQRRAAAALVARGAASAVVTGGHLSDEKDVVDVIADGTRIVELRGERVEGETHGTGCMFATAIAAGLARGLAPVEAVRGAKQVVELGLEGRTEAGKGPPSVRL